MDEKQSQEREQLILGRFYKQRRLDSIPKVKKYLIRDAFGGQRAEIKTMPIGEGRPTVLHEAGFLQQHQGYPGFPLMIWSGNFNNKEMGLITEPLGLSLQQLLDAHPDRRFSLGTVCMIGLQIISMVQILHDKHLVLENITPSVFRLYPSRVQQIMVSDLLYCKRYRNSKNFQVFKLKKIQAIDFFNQFMSFNKISGFNTSRRDDIQSLFYLMVYFLKGKLPWSAIPPKFDHHTFKVIQKVYNELLMDGKSKIKNDLLEGLPREFISIFDYLCQMGFEDKPNYSLIRMKLKKVLLKVEQHQEPVLDWIRYLPSLYKEVLLPREIKMQTFQDELMLKQFYYPWEGKTNLDHFSGVNYFSSEHDQRQNGVSSAKKIKHRSKCQLI